MGGCGPVVDKLTNAADPENTIRVVMDTQLAAAPPFTVTNI
jgi:hypothetical protein